ncbi:hypothetical protein [Sporosarcina ureilytica]|uniref:Uncharacterized protein n=1 Tax=Sporosarcina ureilytica TaxID=298596 RepID=A0A1D8JHH6_9BACL|nr:hypothetical protein [Sporosarcina ureilytica]AOV08134.1 hypothetical protein BI350_11680 [Sporosarcina ureilytica]
MKSKNYSKRNIIQWIAFGIVMLTLVLKIVLLSTGIAYNLTDITMDAITWTGFSIGIILILISYLFPETTKNNAASN